MSPTSAVRRHLGVVLAAALLAVGTPIVVLGGNVAAVEVTAARFVTSARVDRPQATVGQSVAVPASVKSARARGALVDLEVYDQARRTAFPQVWTSQALHAGQARQLTPPGATGGPALCPTSPSRREHAGDTR